MDKAPGTESQITLHNTLGKLPIIIDTQKTREELKENQENHNDLRK